MDDEWLNESKTEWSKITHINTDNLKSNVEWNKLVAGYITIKSFIQIIECIKYCTFLIETSMCVCVFAQICKHQNMTTTNQFLKSRTLEARKGFISKNVQDTGKFRCIYIFFYFLKPVMENISNLKTWILHHILSC